MGRRWTRRSFLAGLVVAAGLDRQAVADGFDLHAASPPARPPETAATTPVLQDEFAGAALNLSLWEPTYSNGGQAQTSNGQVQWYTPGQVTVVDHECLLTARPAVAADQVPAGLSWISGLISSKPTFLYGAVEVCASMPAGPGLWPGVSMFAPEHWPPELDLAEVISIEPGTIHLSDHYDANGVRYYQTFGATGYDPTEYHTYKLIWSPDEVVWMIDGTPLYALTEPAAVPAVPMQLTIGLGVGGPSAWGGPTTTATPVPAVMRIKSVLITR
jgi:beta-glucanase (GH16 family)